MNTTTTKPDDKKAATPAIATPKPEACATGKPESCATTAGKPDACASTVDMPVAQAGTAAKTETCATSSTKTESCGHTHDGKVVSISGNTLVMSGSDGKEHSHTVAADAKVCCDGTACKAQDLKVGSQIRVTTKTDDKQVATKIESLDKQTKFAQSV